MGLSASLVCLGWCIPVIMPYTATAERPGMASGLTASFLFCVGRLFSYVCLASIFLILRALVPISPVLGTFATLVTGIILIFSGLSSVRIIQWRSGFGRLVCQNVAGTKSPLYLGALTGLRPCGPLLAALTFMLTLPSLLETVLFMFFFWMASSALSLFSGSLAGGWPR